MIKKIIKFLLFLFILILILIAYLSVFGINTKKLNERIEGQVSNFNKNITLELESVKISINLKNLSINVKTLEPNIIIDSKTIELENIKTNISLKSFIEKEFTFDDLHISTKAVKLKDLILLVRSFKNSAELFMLGNVIKDGFLISDIKLNFDNNGKVKEDYEIRGFVKKGKLEIFRKYSVNDLNFTFNIKDKNYHFEEIKGNFNQIKLSLPSLKIKEKNDFFQIEGKLVTTKKDIDAKRLLKIFGNNLEDYGIKDINFSSDNIFSFILNRKFKISDFNLKSEINLNELVYKKNLLSIKKYLPNLENSIRLKNHKILVDYKKNYLVFSGEGKIKIKDKIDNINYKVIKKNEQYAFESIINLNQNVLLIDILQYQKKKDLESILKLSGIYKKDNSIEFDSISLKENENNFLIKNLNLNNDFKFLDIEKIKLNFINNNNIQNDISFKKNEKEYEFFGNSFDASKLIDELLDGEYKEESSSMLEDFNSNININIKNFFIDEVTYTKNLKGKIDFKNNEIFKLNLNSRFPNNKELNLSIITNEQGEKITTFFTDYPKPLVKRYKFIKGFEGGSMDFYSVTKDEMSSSLLTIDNFKVKEVPIFAKLLSLASLQGVADLLTGEGIRFTDFEMKFTNGKGLMTIEEVYAIGPAVSILMDGYIQSEKLVSLRGTLVPATTINKTIASIPIIGDILVGKKTGEGIFGVSFKIKGPPKKIKTTVNPIKTLTPRFITRTLEKIKKN